MLFISEWWSTNSNDSVISLKFGLKTLQVQKQLCELTYSLSSSLYQVRPHPQTAGALAYLEGFILHFISLRHIKVYL